MLEGAGDCVLGDGGSAAADGSRCLARTRCGGHGGGCVTPPCQQDMPTEVCCVLSVRAGRISVMKHGPGHMCGAVLVTVQ